MSKTLKIISKREDVEGVDNVAVKIKLTSSVTRERVCTPLQIKNEIAGIDEQIANLKSYKAEKEAELAEITAEAEKVFA